MNHAAFLRGVKKYKNHEKNLSAFVDAYRRHATELYYKQRARELGLPSWLPAMWLSERHHP